MCDEVNLPTTRGKVDAPGERHLRGTQRALDAHVERARGTVQRDPQPDGSCRLDADQGGFGRGHPGSERGVEAAGVDVCGTGESCRADVRLERSQVEGAAAQRTRELASRRCASA